MVSGTLDKAGRAILDVFDYRGTIILTLLVVVICTIISWRRSRAMPALGNLLRACLGAVTVVTGFTVLCVFALTKPPYIEALSHESLEIVTLVTFFSCPVFGVREIVALFKGVGKD
jgi:heme A synthase